MPQRDSNIPAAPNSVPALNSEAGLNRYLSEIRKFPLNNFSPCYRSVVLLPFHRLKLNLKLLDPALDFIEFLRQRIDFDSKL